MATNTAALKTFAQQTRSKLLSLIGTKMDFVLTQDNAELRGYETQIGKLKEAVNAKLKEVDEKSKNPIADARKLVAEEVAYTWFNRVMALRFMDANGYNTPMVVTPAPGQMRPEILQDAMAGSVDEDLRIAPDDLMLPEAQLYRRLLVAVCNKLGETMPFLFEHICDYTELLLPDDLLSDQSFVSDIRKGMTDEDCQNVEIVGWLYQYYISSENERLIKSKKKYKRNELAPASQLFTPDWIVRYMVDNTLGQYWSEMYPDSHLTDSLEFYIHPENPSVLPKREVKPIEEIKFFDPCVGSGHIISYAYDIFYKMYEELGYTSSQIPQLILKHNLWGTDIDPCAAQLASFVLTMKARGSYSRLFRKGAVTPNITYYKDFHEDDKFKYASSLGSLINISPLEADKHISTHNDEGSLFGQLQKHLNTLYQILGQRYDLVVTNPPYISSSRMDDITKAYVEEHYSSTKYDLFATFILRCLELCEEDGLTGYMTPFVWMFIASYEELRKKLINNHFINNLIQLEYSGFEGATVPICTFTLRKSIVDSKGSYIKLSDFSGSENQAPRTLDAIRDRTCGWFYYFNQKDFNRIPGHNLGYWLGENFLKIFSIDNKIFDLCESKAGTVTGNDNYFLLHWYEVTYLEIDFGPKNIGCYSKYHLFQKGGGFRRYYGNNDYVIKLQDLYNPEKVTKSVRRGDANFYFKSGISWSMIGSSMLKSFRAIVNSVCGVAAPSLYLEDAALLPYVLALLNSKIASSLLVLYNPTLNTLISDVSNIPVIFSNVLQINEIVSINTNILLEDWDSHETSWDFQFNEILALDSEKKYVDTINEIYEGTGILVDLAAPQLNSLEWRVGIYKAKWEDKFHRLHANEEELNRQFIEMYGLQDELTPDVPLNEITILQKGEISIEDNEIVWHEDVIIKQLISYLVGCFMGRYSVDKPGLIIASQHQDLNALGMKVDGIDNDAPGRLTIDDDGIVPILNGEYFSDDMTVRIEQAIKVLFGEDAFQENLRYIDAKLGKPLREYLFKDFYADHIDGKMYQKRPIYWLFSSKMGDKHKKGHFKALVYMHRIEPDTLSKLHADYVVPYIDKIEQQQQEAEDQTLRDDLSQAQRNKARKAADELSEQLREVKDFEQILVQMASQRISIDLDDGVRKNYPKFYPLVEPIKGLDKEE